MQFHVIPKNESPENNPELLLSEYDCVWVSFLGQEKPEPLKNRLLQWLDWRLQGVISRYLLEESFSQEKTTFVPTLAKHKLNYLVLDPDRLTPADEFARQCTGLQAKKVLLVCENSEAADRLKKELTSKKLSEFSAEVYLSVGSK